MEQLTGLRKTLESLEHWLDTYREDENRIEMWRCRHSIIEGIIHLQLKFFDRNP